MKGENSAVIEAKPTRLFPICYIDVVVILVSCNIVQVAIMHVGVRSVLEHWHAEQSVEGVEAPNER